MFRSYEILFNPRSGQWELRRFETDADTHELIAVYHTQEAAIGRAIAWVKRLLLQGYTPR